MEVFKPSTWSKEARDTAEQLVKAAITLAVLIASEVVNAAPKKITK